MDTQIDRIADIEIGEELSACFHQIGDDRANGGINSRRRRAQRGLDDGNTGPAAGPAVRNNSKSYEIQAFPVEDKGKAVLGHMSDIGVIGAEIDGAIGGIGDNGLGGVGVKITESRHWNVSRTGRIQAGTWNGDAAFTAFTGTRRAAGAWIGRRKTIDIHKA